MNYKRINRKQALLVAIGLLFIFVLLFAVSMKRAISIQRDLRLSVSSLSNYGDSYYGYSRNSEKIYFKLRDSIVSNGFSNGNYIAFEKGEDGYDRPIYFNRVPSMFHPCLSVDASRSSNINSLLCYFCKRDSCFYFKMMILNNAIQKGSSISLIVPSLTYDYKEIEVDDVSITKLLKEMMQTPEQAVDSMVDDAVKYLEAYGQTQHCYTTDNYADIIHELMNDNKGIVDAYFYLLQDTQASSLTKLYSEKLLEKKKEEVKNLVNNVPELENALHQIIDGYRWITPNNYQTLLDTLGGRSIIGLREYNDEDNKIIEDTYDIIGYTGDRADTKTLRYTLDFWKNRWKDGSAEWCYEMFKRMAKL